MIDLPQAPSERKPRIYKKKRWDEPVVHGRWNNLKVDHGRWTSLKRKRMDCCAVGPANSSFPDGGNVSTTLRKYPPDGGNYLYNTPGIPACRWTDRWVPGSLEW
jgi:hypothetical protein